MATGRATVRDGNLSGHEMLEIAVDRAGDAHRKHRKTGIALSTVTGSGRATGLARSTDLVDTQNI